VNADADAAHVMQKCKEHPEGKSLDLASFLIMPVQRIPRYNLLLTDMMRNTWVDHPDYASLKKVTRLISPRRSPSVPCACRARALANRVRVSWARIFFPRTQATDKIQSIASFINERKREAENVSKTLEISNKITGNDKVSVTFTLRKQPLSWIARSLRD
jgi:hypothetical protein